MEAERKMEGMWGEEGGQAKLGLECTVVRNVVYCST